MKTINIVYLIVSIISTAIVSVLAVFAYLDEKPRIKASGEYSSWSTPSEVSFGGYRSYTKVDIRNVGDAEAKVLKLSTPFRGIYRVDDDGASKEFENDISLDDLNPGEGYIVEIWSQTSRPWLYPDDLVINHTRGISNVDFGYRAIGMSGKIFWLVDQLWFVILILLIYVTGILGYYIYLKLNRNTSDSAGIGN